MTQALFEDPAAKGPKQERPRYLNGDGARTPSVTEVLGIINKPGLFMWARTLGLRGEDPVAVRDRRAAEGNVLHERIRAYFTGQPAEVAGYAPETRAAGLVAYIQWLQKWLPGHDVRPVLIEQPLVSERYGYGGTPDLVAYVDGVLTVLDWKTSKRVYPEHVLQAVAYQLLAYEHGHRVEAVRIVRIGTTDSAGWGEHVVTETRDYAQAFLAALRLYRRLAILPAVEEHA